MGLLKVILFISIAFISTLPGCCCNGDLHAWHFHDYKNHTCNRECVEGEAPRLCYYNFYVEFYTTMSAACYDCPSNKAHCYLPQCIAANGLTRPVTVVNRMLPGPAIQVCKGDTIEVDVTNLLQMGMGISIHWHGVRQLGTNHMDGTSMVTQCPIEQWSTMTYRFQAIDAGTFYWHSHSSLQRADGLFGHLVVRQPKSLDPHGGLFDLDLPEHQIVFTDWSKTGGGITTITDMYYHKIVNFPASIIVNGLGTARDGPPVPLPEFYVKPGLRYRFRLVFNGVLNCPIEFRIDNHTMLAITSDGKGFEPVEIDSVVLQSGERLDFILKSKDKTDGGDQSYWMRVKGQVRCMEDQIIQAAILRYEGTPDPEGEVTFHNTNKKENEVSLNDLSDLTSNGIQIADLESLDTDEPDSDLIDTPDKKFYVALDPRDYQAERFMPPENPDCANRTDVDSKDYLDKCKSTWQNYQQLNFINNQLPGSPLLTQFEDNLKSLFCNQSSTSDRNCKVEMCMCVHMLEVALGDLVEMIMVNLRLPLLPLPGMLAHPMHLHGHYMRVVGQIRNDTEMDVDRFKELERRGEVKRRRSKAPYKDSVSIGDASAVILRFRANNPGFWFFHCHMEVHTELGMALVIKVGDVKQMPQPEEPFPECYAFSPKHKQKGIPSWAIEAGLLPDETAQNDADNLQGQDDLEGVHGSLGRKQVPSKTESVGNGGLKGQQNAQDDNLFLLGGLQMKQQPSTDKYGSSKDKTEVPFAVFISIGVVCVLVVSMGVFLWHRNRNNVSDLLGSCRVRRSADCSYQSLSSEDTKSLKEAMVTSI